MTMHTVSCISALGFCIIKHIAHQTWGRNPGLVYWQMDLRNVPSFLVLCSTIWRMSSELLMDSPTRCTCLYPSWVAAIPGKCTCRGTSPKLCLKAPPSPLLAVNHPLSFHNSTHFAAKPRAQGRMEHLWWESQIWKFSFLVQGAQWSNDRTILHVLACMGVALCSIHSDVKFWVKMPLQAQSTSLTCQAITSHVYITCIICLDSDRHIVHMYLFRLGLGEYIIGPKCRENYIYIRIYGSILPNAQDQW